jgi:ATP-binding cassette subfamily B protein
VAAAQSGPFVRPDGEAVPREQAANRALFGLRSFASFVAPQRARMVVVGVTFALANSTLAVVPFFIGKLIAALAVPGHRHQAVTYFWVLIGLSTAHSVLWHSSEYIYLRVVRPLQFRYEALLFQTVIRQPYHYFVDKFTGKVASYVSSLGDELGMLAESVFFNYCGDLTSLVVVMAILLTTNLPTGLIFVTSVGLMYVTGRKMIRPANAAEMDFADVKSTKNGKIIDIVGNFVNVKAFQTEHSESALVRRQQDTATTASHRSFVRGIWFWGSLSMIVRNLIWPATIGLNFYLFLHGHENLAQFTTVLSSVLIFSSFIWNIVWNFSQLSLRVARVEEAHHYLFKGSNVTLDARARVEEERELPAFGSSVQVRALSFSYPDAVDAPVLQDIDLSLRKGEKVGLVGRSGSGKSTLTKLMLGYYDAPVGSLAIDDVDISSKELARLVSLVPQDTSLFHRSIEDNIRYAAKREVTRDEVIEASRRAHAHEFIERTPGGYDALVGERGVKLSAGQRQRIAIARAFLDDKPILVLDEATSALDSESEILVQDALEQLWGEKTVLAIAHRLSTLRHMDRIVVIDRGSIVETGSHDELVSQRGIYSRLWSHQSEGFIAADA